MARTIKAAPQVEIDVMTLKQGTSTYRLIGDTPFFSNRMAAKAKRELLFPHGPMTKTQKATKLKHAPYAEYRELPLLGTSGRPNAFRDDRQRAENVDCVGRVADADERQQDRNQAIGPIAGRENLALGHSQTRHVGGSDGRHQPDA